MVSPENTTQAKRLLSYTRPTRGRDFKDLREQEADGRAHPRARRAAVVGKPVVEDVANGAGAASTRGTAPPVVAAAAISKALDNMSHRSCGNRPLKGEAASITVFAPCITAPNFALRGQEELSAIGPRPTRRRCGGWAFGFAHQNALIAAQDYPGVHCVDGRHLSTGYGQLAILAAEMAAQGKTAEEILEYVAGLPERVSTSFILDKLEYMAKGGRCSAVAAFGANLLKLKPCLAIRDGKLEIISKYRGSLKDVLVKYTHDRLQEAGQLDTRRAFITHTVEDPELVELVRREMLAYAPFEEIIVNDAGPGITAHCGQNCLGIMFIKAAE